MSLIYVLLELYDLNVGTVNEDETVVAALVTLNSMFLSNSIIGLSAWDIKVKLASVIKALMSS